MSMQEESIVKKIGWEIVEYIRRAISPFFIKMMSGLTMLAISLIQNTALAICLMAAMLVIDGLLSFILIRGTGENAYKMKVVGQLKRENKPTGVNSSSMGTYRPCKEYRPYKGVTIGLAVSLLPIVLILVGALGDNSVARAVLMIVSGWVYMPVYVIALAVKGPMPEDFTGAWIGNETLWWGFILITLFVVISAVAYIVGGNREKVRQYMLTRRTESVDAALQSRTKGEKR